jgi:hypothetical protein
MCVTECTSTTEGAAQQPLAAREQPCCQLALPLKATQAGTLRCCCCWAAVRAAAAPSCGCSVAPCSVLAAPLALLAAQLAADASAAPPWLPPGAVEGRSGASPLLPPGPRLPGCCNLQEAANQEKCR